MNSFLAMVRSNIVAQAVLSIALGMLLALMPQITTLTVIYLLALCLAIAGATSLVSYFRANSLKREPGVLATGVFLLLLALIVILFPQAVASMFSLILGILLVVGGIVNIARSVELRGSHSTAWILMLAVSVLVSLGGIVIIINPFETTVAFVLALGILLIVKGVVDLIIEASTSRMFKKR